MGVKGDDAIDPEYAVPDDVMRRMIQEAYDDPRPSIPAEEVFARLELKHAERMKQRNAHRPS
jgi:antitoxin ParD1/3/4